jgi:hypothetical protein
MLNDNDFYVVLKLTSGEQVLAALSSEDEDYIMLEHPMVMTAIPDFDNGKERITAAPLCSFTDEQSFVINKAQVLFIKKLHHLFIPQYRKIVSEYEKSSLFVPADSVDGEALHWDAEEETEDPEFIFVEGNDTKH